jgi:hypothetical protein
VQLRTDSDAYLAGKIANLLCHLSYLSLGIFVPRGRRLQVCDTSIPGWIIQACRTILLANFSTTPTQALAFDHAVSFKSSCKRWLECGLQAPKDHFDTEKILRLTLDLCSGFLCDAQESREKEWFFRCPHFLGVTGYKIRQLRSSILVRHNTRCIWRLTSLANTAIECVLTLAD